MEVMVVHFCLELNKDPEFDDKYLKKNNVLINCIHQIFFSIPTDNFSVPIVMIFFKNATPLKKAVTTIIDNGILLVGEGG